MKRTVYNCDRCGKDLKDCQGLSVDIGRRSDAAGSMETITEEFDICHSCSVSLLQAFLCTMSYETASKWVDAVQWTPARLRDLQEGYALRS